MAEETGTSGCENTTLISVSNNTQKCIHHTEDSDDHVITSKRRRVVLEDDHHENTFKVSKHKTDNNNVIKAKCIPETEMFISINKSFRDVPKTSSKKCMESEEMPSVEELEEFFAKAEKYEQKRFAEKYNFDIVKDVPIEGRYQWIKLKP